MPSLLVALSVVGSLSTLAAVVASLRGRRRAVAAEQRRGAIWAEMYHLGGDVADGTDFDASARLEAALARTSDPLLAATALGVVAREHGRRADDELFRLAATPRVVAAVLDRLESSAAFACQEALGVIGALRLHDLLGDVAVLAGHEDDSIVQAAVEALTALKPSTAHGVLTGLAVQRGAMSQWIPQAIGRAEEAQRSTSRRVTVPVPRTGQYGASPDLSEFDEQTVTSLALRLSSAETVTAIGAIDALATHLSHPAARIALAGGLGAPERSVRYAVAASLSCSSTGRALLEHVATSDHSTDAARIALETLWFDTPPSGMVPAIA